MEQEKTDALTIREKSTLREVALSHAVVTAPNNISKANTVDGKEVTSVIRMAEMYYKWLTEGEINTTNK